MDKQTLLLAQFFDELAKKTVEGNSAFRAYNSPGGSKKDNKIYYDDKHGTKVGTNHQYPIIFDFKVNKDGSHTIIPDTRFPNVDFVLDVSNWNNQVFFKLLAFNKKDDTIVCIENGRWYVVE